jgi:cell wall-associated NlpC family hydrolase
MFNQYLEQMQAGALAAFPNEAVFFITEAGCTEVENIHEHPDKYFAVADGDHRRAMAEGLLAVVHSHPDNIAAPSSLDMKGQMSTAVPWGIIGTDGVGVSDIAWWGKGAPKAPLIGRTFRHGITDCYSLIKDYYEIEKGIELPEFPRDWEWWKTNANLFEDGFKIAGFVKIDAPDAQPGDVWLANIGSEFGVANHGGLLLEDGLMLHQIGSKDPVDHSRPSAREPIYRYMPHITHWLRYVGTQGA